MQRNSNPGNDEASPLHKTWQKVSSVVIASFVPVFFLGTMFPTAEPARFTLDLLNWPLDGATTYESADVHFLSALTSGFFLGWGVTVWLLASSVYDKAPEAVPRAVLFGLLSWFVRDISGSSARSWKALALLEPKRAVPPPKAQFLVIFRSNLCKFLALEKDQGLMKIDRLKHRW